MAGNKGSSTCCPVLVLPRSNSRNVRDGDPVMTTDHQPAAPDDAAVEALADIMWTSVDACYGNADDWIVACRGIIAELATAGFQITRPAPDQTLTELVYALNFVLDAWDSGERTEPKPQDFGSFAVEYLTAHNIDFPRSASGEIHKRIFDTLDQLPYLMVPSVTMTATEYILKIADDLTAALATTAPEDGE